MIRLNTVVIIKSTNNYYFPRYIEGCLQKLYTGTDDFETNRPESIISIIDRVNQYHQL